MADVAELAGVSHQTVSRVLNGHPRVRAETRARVLHAIDVLGYRRNMTARALVTRRSHRLGVVSFDTILYGPASTVHGIERAAREAGYFVTIMSLRTIDRAGVNEAIGHLAAQGVDGVVVVAPQRAAAEALADLPAGLPAVAVEGRHEGHVPVVSVDQFAGARQATAYLLGLGHETVWHVSGPDDWLEAEGRREGWRAALSAAGRTVPDPLTGDWTPASGYRAGRALAGRVADVTAVLVANDQMALGLLRAFSESGVQVPGQVSVVGFDDIPEAAYFTPPLTTVRQDFGEVGRLSIGLLLKQIDPAGTSGHEHLVVPPQLIARDSTDRARTARLP
ncbi:LacI family DNA-binding transcriptional regulator [Nonomuraea sp. PA05]|uniref:LacI family DNA-binding transcriptional regulator n=1 Tax=Nonomuraea sp. PA05 TaxID=2604466 RepID=UPI0011D61ADF|nr:LacI family DNA-binding transcriptional regulator [Nonomuraea sp. PA05]TYB57451.1 LacI family DNA-binding transcriptional regulator [Nonomuraea sp. PA05]